MGRDKNIKLVKELWMHTKLNDINDLWVKQNYVHRKNFIIKLN